jgi:adenosylcobinamide-GDP ribazoletransferase
VRDALAFLTVLPAGRRTGPPGKAAIAAFPLVGVLVGLVWWTAGRFGTQVWAPGVGAALVLVADLLVTGGLHVDGLADEADGIASRLPADEAVAVMREGPVGAIGAAAAAIVLLLRFALLAALLGAGHRAGLLVAPVAGRFAMVLVMAWGNEPQGPSLSDGIRQTAKGFPLIASAVLAAGAAAVLAGFPGLVASGGGCLAALANAAYAGHRFGGVTGDVIGAGGLLAETVALAVLAAR